jgi:carbon starvation protein CstA
MEGGVHDAPFGFWSHRNPALSLREVVNCEQMGVLWLLIV